MRLEEEQHGDVMVLRPTVTQLNAPVVGEFKAMVAEVIERGHDQLILDLSKVEFVDSTALGSIVALLKLVDRTGHLLLCNASDTVRAMMEVTRMTRIFPLHEDVQAARAAMAEVT